jgi:multiple sugar transport system ATP-binding protein
MTLADKIVLLNAGEPVQRDGSVAQFGAPLQLYHHPVNKFVAGFIGSPKMNFVAGKLTQANDRSAITKVADVACTAHVNATRLKANSDVTLGVRPEHVQIVSTTGDNVVTGLVAFLEQLGEASYVYVRLSGGELVTVRESGHSSVSVGNPIQLYFPPHCLHVFDENDVATPRTAEPHLLSQPLVAGVSISRTATAS